MMYYIIVLYMATPTHKICSLCKLDKPAADFYWRKSRTALASQCKACEYLRHRDYYLKNKKLMHEYVWRSWIKRTYGVTYQEYDKMYVSQGGKCYICKEKDTKRLAVDHHHLTGQVRKLLCQKCNRAIGLINDRPSLARSIAEYLEAHHVRG